MLSSHEICPICQAELKHIKRLAVKCEIANNNVMSFLESICNRSKLNPEENFPHSFFQVSSLYGMILFQSIHFIDLARSIEINYINNSSKIIFWGYQDEKETQVIGINDKTFDLDYPKLERIKNKMQTYAIFM